MPEPNGYELCERIKSDERTRHLPVVLLVGTFEPFNEAEARRVGADEVLTKPFQSIRDLVNKVGGLLGGSDEKAANAARDARSAEETTQDLSPFAADARAANPNPETATPAEAQTSAASAFDNFDMDDATIQSTPAAAFDARAAHQSPPALEINEEEQFSDRGETDEAFVLGDEDESPAETHAVNTAAAGASGNSYAASSNASTEAVPVASSASAFSAHAARAAEADDALLELGDIAPAHGGGNAANEADDFILDIGDDDSFAPVAAAPAQQAAQTGRADDVAEIDMLFAENAPLTGTPEAFDAPEAFTETDVFAETQSSAEAQASEEMEMWSSPAAVPAAEAHPALLAEEAEELEAPEISESPALLFANEPPAPDEPDMEIPAGSGGHSHAEQVPAWDKEPVAASIVAHAGGAAATVGASGESQAAESSAADTGSAAVAAEASPSVGSSESNQAASSVAPALSPEMIDEVVRRVVAQMSEQVVREIAWEVVPDLAERLIRQRLAEEKTRTTP
jgi:CheY-like chemotaxis protein